MTIEEQIAAFNELSRYITNELPEFAKQVAANDLVALITNRVVQRGENFQGSSFTPYSTNTVAAWRFWGKSRNQTAEKKVRAISRAKGVLTGKEFRLLNNLRADKKNFEFTGEMWKKFGIIKFVNIGGRFTITIGGTTPAAQQKIDDNSDQEGLSIIENNNAEEKLVQQAAGAWLEQQANRILNE